MDGRRVVVIAGLAATVAGGCGDDTDACDLQLAAVDPQQVQVGEYVFDFVANDDDCESAPLSVEVVVTP